MRRIIQSLHLSFVARHSNITNASSLTKVHNISIFEIARFSWAQELFLRVRSLFYGNACTHHMYNADSYLGNPCCTQHRDVGAYVFAISFINIAVVSPVVQGRRLVGVILEVFS